MKKYLLFACPEFYPKGGWEDYKSESDDMQDLIDIFDKNCKEDQYEWSSCHIVEWEKKKIVAKADYNMKWIKNAHGIQIAGELEIVWVTEDL